MTEVGLENVKQQELYLKNFEEKLVNRLVWKAVIAHLVIAAIGLAL